MFQSIFGILDINNASTYLHKVSRISKLEEGFKSLSNKELQEKTTSFFERLSAGETLEMILEEAFAIVREASFRVLKLRQFDTQIVGGLILHEGKIAEMATGEGKTLISVLPTYLNALNGKGVHVITVNNYLTNRDAMCAGRVHKFLGLNVGIIDNGMSQTEKRLAYLKHITYVTHSDIGFDYLKDNIATSLFDIVQRPFHFCIVDEADSILIDEAKSPLVISKHENCKPTKYRYAHQISTQLTRGIHYDTDEKSKHISLTDEGICTLEKRLNTNNLYNIRNPWAPYIFNALKSKEFYFKNVNYLVKEKEISIIDPFTGREMQGRRWSDGLHQAMEAKEGIPIQGTNEAAASITYQNLFLMYPKISGMSGTAKSEEIELNDIYKLNVVCIPSHKKTIRIDYPDLIYKTEAAKWKAVVSECIYTHSRGRPVLIGTTNINNSENLSSILEKRGIKHNLLNAKAIHAERETEIIAQAGEIGSVTIATNMAGRGTDILLGGNETYITKYTLKTLLNHNEPFIAYKDYELEDPEKIRYFLMQKLKQTKYNSNDIDKYLSLISDPITITVTDQCLPILRAAYCFLLEKIQKKVLKKREKVISLGGLHVVGTERNSSKRIDTQLRGRSGRQGDPGSSKFFLSLEDDIFRVQGSDLIKRLINLFYIEESIPIKNKILISQLDSIQRKIEDNYYYSRKQLFEYNKIINTHREIIYSERKKMLETSFLKKWILHYAEDLVFNQIDKYYIEKKPFTTTRKKLTCYIKKLLGDRPWIKQIVECTQDKKTIKKIMSKHINTSYELKKKYMELFDDDLMEKTTCLSVINAIDQCWKIHLQDMSLLKENIGWRNYAQKDPLIQYKKESYNLFLSMINKIKYFIVYRVLYISSKTSKKI